jgi:hypothetical protein
MTTTTTTDMTLVPAHLVRVESDGYEFLAECSCGWASDWYATPEAADLAGGEHVEGAVGPPDVMDGFMSGLLDLQDDLAAAVIWLAENWSAHLPGLGWFANGGDRDIARPAVTVLAYCDPGELITAAGVLGAAPTDDPPNDDGHTRYRRASRDFGRVRIQAYAKADACERAEAAR